MFFYKVKNGQVLDLQGNMILSHNADLIRTRTKNNGPRSVKNGYYVKDIPNLKFFRKIRASWVALCFIWGGSRAVEAKTISHEAGLK